MAVQLINVSAYARHRGCDEKAVRKAIEERRITPIPGKNGRNMIDPVVADIQWAQNTRARADSSRATAIHAPALGLGSLAPSESLPATDTAASPAQDSGYSHYRSLESKEDWEKKRRENMVAVGKLVDRDLVERAVFDAFRSLRDAALAVSQRAAPRCIGLADARDIEHVIADELRKAFEGWEEAMQGRLPARETLQ